MVSDQPSSDTVERLERAEKLKWEGKYADALAILEQLLIEDPENVSALEEIADNELSLGRMQRAEAAAKRAVVLDAKSYTGHYIIGFLHSRAERWREAVEELQIGNALKSNNPEILRCLGWALFMSGKRAQGIVTLERALNLDDQSAYTLCDLGMAYVQVKSLIKARSLFLRAVEIDPRNARAKECIELVNRLQGSTQGHVHQRGVRASR